MSVVSQWVQANTDLFVGSSLDSKTIDPRSDTDYGHFTVKEW
jgi:hypothetical protein